MIIHKFKKLSPYFLIIFFCLLYGSAIIFSVPSRDTLYYWDWGQHLDLSYYDGPPMIAYFFRGATALFGDSIFAINFFSVFCNLSVGILIYLLASNLFDRRVAFWSVLIWLLNPITFIQYTFSFTYDTPAALFWMASLLSFYWAHQQKKNRYLYLTGLFLGCMVLSKYTGVLLYVALLLMILSVRPYRYLLKNVHLYLAGVFSIVIFLPVLIWNYQNHFDSFVYQSQHGFHHPFKLSGLFLYFLQTLENYSFVFLLLLYFVTKHFKKMFTDERLALLFYPSAVTLLFFALAAPYQFRLNWNETFLMTAAILVAYFALQSYVCKRVLMVALYLYGFALIAIMTVTVASKRLGFSENLSGLNVKQSALAIIPFYNPKLPVVAYDWMTAAAMAYYLPGHPQIYSLSPAANQYRYWSQSMAGPIKQGKVPELLYVTPILNVMLDAPMKCNLVKATHNRRPLFVYDCHS